jgi:hypothetical protein
MKAETLCESGITLLQGQRMVDWKVPITPKKRSQEGSEEKGLTKRVRKFEERDGGKKGLGLMGGRSPGGSNLGPSGCLHACRRVFLVTGHGDDFGSLRAIGKPK